MEFLSRHLKLILFLLAVVALIVFTSGIGRGAITEKNFVGKWVSSRSATPMYLYANGEWEINADDGTVMQYGVWQFKDQMIIWSYMLNSRFLHDPNTVLSVKPTEFQVREQDGSITTFTRLE